MLLFCCPNNMSGCDRIIVPLERVYEIYSFGCDVYVNYNNGELVEVEGTYQKKIESVKMTFDSADDANKIFRQFYKACSTNAGAFYFGNEKAIEKKKLAADEVLPPEKELAVEVLPPDVNVKRFNDDEADNLMLNFFNSLKG